MSLYHKRVFLRQKNSNLSQLVNSLNITNIAQPHQGRSADNSSSSQSFSNISSTNKHYNTNPNNSNQPFSPQTAVNRSKLKIKVLSVLQTIVNNQLYIILMSILTIWTIFSVDIDKGFFNVYASTYFSSVYSVAILLFLLQSIMLSLTKSSYFLGFYFWVDCLSTSSMVLQLIWIENLMSGSTSVTVALSFAKLTKASRLSRIGARASKMMKLIRSIKFAKLFGGESLQDGKKDRQLQQHQETKVGFVNKKRGKQELRSSSNSDSNGNDNNDDNNSHNQNQPNNSQPHHHQNIINNNQQQVIEQYSIQSQSSSTSHKQSSSSTQNNQHKLQVRQTQINHLMTFKPIIQKKQLSYYKPFQNLHHDGMQQHKQEVIIKGTTQEDLSIEAEDDILSQQQKNIESENNQLSYQHCQNLQDNHDYFLGGSQQIESIQQNKHQQQDYSNLTISPSQHPINNMYPNNFAIPDIDQPSQTLVESLQQISQEGKNNIQDIMKIFFTQNMSHFIEKGKQIHQSNQHQPHHFHLQNKISLQENIIFHENQKEIKQQKENKGQSGTKNKIIKSKKNKNNKNNQKLNKQQAQLEIQQPKKLKITDSHKLKEHEIKSTTNNSNNKIRKTTSNPKLQKQQFSTQKLNNSNEKYNKQQEINNSGRLFNLKKKQSISQSNKCKELKQKFHRPHHANTITIEVPFANIVEKMERQMHFEPLERHNVDPVKQAEIQKKYDELMQREKLQNEPKKVFSSYNLKVGQVLKQQIQKNIVVMVMGLVIMLPILTADVWFNANPGVSSGAQLFINNIWQLPTPQAQTQLLHSFIQTGLSMNTPLQYFLIPLNSTCCQFPRQFTSYINNSILDYSQLRISQEMVVKDGNITIIFSRKWSTQLNAYLNLGRSLFITTLLVFCSIIFMRDIQNHAITPLQKMSTLINKISINPFQVLKQINQEKNYTIRDSQQWQSRSLILVNNTQKGEQEQELQTNILSNVIIKITSLLTVGAGEIGAEMISRNIQTVGRQMQGVNTSDKYSLGGQYLLGVYVYIEMRGFELICDIFGDQIFRYMNRVSEIVHLCCIEMGGIPIQYDGKGFLLLFKTDSVVQRVVLAERKSTRQLISKRSDYTRSGRGKVNERKNSNSNNDGYNNSSRRKDMNSSSRHGESITKHQHANIYHNYQNIGDTIIQSQQVVLNQQQSFKTTKSEHQSEQQSEQNVLGNLSLLAISAMTRIMLQINQLEQSRMLYQCILQRFPPSNNNTTNRYNRSNTHSNAHSNHNNAQHSDTNSNNKFVHANNHNSQQQPWEMFDQNYQPHLVNAAVHVGECVYGSLGSKYKLECKCIGYDIAYVRHMCHMIAQQSYGVSNIISEDIHSLLFQSQYLIQRLKIRQLDHVNIKQLRHKDYKKNPDLHFIPADKLSTVKVQKQTVTKFYTCDFYAKLQTFNSNESNFGHSVVDFKLNKSQYTNHNKSSLHSKYLPSNTFNSKLSVPGNLHSFQTIDDMSQHCLIAYKQRQKWLSFSQKDDPILLLSKLQSQYPQLKQSKTIYETEFYVMWSQALDAFYSQELTESLNQFKNLHTYNQPFYDGPSRFFIHRIQKITGLNDYNNDIRNFNTYNQHEHNLHQHGTQFSLVEPMFGVRDVIWKL